MSDDISFEWIGIAELLKQEILIVPANQREYSWTKEIEVKSFIRDINNAMRDTNKTYFLGTVVLTKGKRDTLEIADGQQRLATTAMIISAIRDYFSNKGYADQVTSIDNEFLSVFDRDTEELIPRLSLNHDDNEYFSNTVIFKKHKRKAQNPARRSHRLIEDAYKEIKENINFLVNQYGEINAKPQLNEMINFLKKKVRIIKLVVGNEETAFTLFETLNDRGLKTSQADLVKNYIFKLADDRLGEAQKLWSSMKGAIESISETDEDITMEFLRIACCVISGPTSKKEVLKKIQEKARGQSSAIQVLTDLEKMSRGYAAILNSNHQKWNTYPNDIRGSITTMSELGVAQIRSLMLSVAIYFDEKAAAEVFRILLAWSVRLNVKGIREGRVGDEYAKLAYKIYNKEITKIDQLKKESESIIVTDSDFKLAFSVATVSAAKTARYYLRALEQTAQGINNPEFVPNTDVVINLEHILPENPSNDWNIVGQDAQAYINRIGNLALLQADKNNKAANLKFDEKTEIYKKSTYLLTNQIAEFDKWGVEEIEIRQKVLADLAVKTWKL